MKKIQMLKENNLTFKKRGAVKNPCSLAPLRYILTTIFVANNALFIHICINYLEEALLY